MRHIVNQRFGGFRGVAQRQPQTHGPGQNTDIVGVNQRMERVGDHAHQQAFQHFNNAARRVDIRIAGHQRQVGREHKADHYRHQRRGEGPQQVEEQDRADIGFLPVLVVGD